MNSPSDSLSFSPLSLFSLFILLTAGHLLLALTLTNYIISTDEIYYIGNARKFAATISENIYPLIVSEWMQQMMDQPNILYPITILPAFFLKTWWHVYISIKAINSIIWASTSIIVISIGRRLQLGKSLSLLLGILIAILPMSNFTGLIMSDTIQFWYFFILLYFTIGYFQKPNIYSTSVLSVILATAFLAKITFLLFFPIFALTTVFKLLLHRSDKQSLKDEIKWLLYLEVTALLLYTLLRHFSSTSTLGGHYSQDISTYVIAFQYPAAVLIQFGISFLWLLTPLLFLPLLTGYTIWNHRKEQLESTGLLLFYFSIFTTLAFLSLLAIHVVGLDGWRVSKQYFLFHDRLYSFLFILWPLAYLANYELIKITELRNLNWIIAICIIFLLAIGYQYPEVANGHDIIHSSFLSIKFFFGHSYMWVMIGGALIYIYAGGFKNKSMTLLFLLICFGIHKWAHFYRISYYTPPAAKLDIYHYPKITYLDDAEVKAIIINKDRLESSAPFLYRVAQTSPIVPQIAMSQQELRNQLRQGRLQDANYLIFDTIANSDSLILSGEPPHYENFRSYVLEYYSAKSLATKLIPLKPWLLNKNIGTRVAMSRGNDSTYRLNGLNYPFFKAQHVANIGPS